MVVAVAVVAAVAVIGALAWWSGSTGGDIGSGSSAEPCVAGAASVAAVAVGLPSRQELPRQLPRHHLPHVSYRRFPR